jgi:hypothetical protein
LATFFYFYKWFMKKSLSLRGSAPDSRQLKPWLVLSIITLASMAAYAQQNYAGSTGYINTHSAMMRPDGTMAIGLSHASPYTTLFVAVQALPWLEVSGRYQQTGGVPAFANTPGANYGSQKDKSFAGKAQLLPEGGLGLAWMPALALGMEDIGVGTQGFASVYGVASKTLPLAGGQLETSLGYGRQRIAGAFGGMRYSHAAVPGWAVVADYDRINFKNDVGAALVGLDKRPIGRFNAALEYASPSGWALQMGMRDGKPSVNASLQVPFGSRSLVPKTQEPAPYISFAPRPDASQWRAGEEPLRSALVALHRDGFRNVKTAYTDQTLKVSLSDTRFISTSQAAGRAMRVLLAHSPQQAQRLEVTVLAQGMPTVHYTATDLEMLQRYFNGAVPLQALSGSLQVRAADQRDEVVQSDMQGLLQSLADSQVLAGGADGVNTGVAYDQRLSGETQAGHTWSVAPSLEVFFNDPSGAFKAALGVEGAGQLRLGQGLALDANATVRLLENITDVTQPSNSLLPHVRTDVAEYFRGSSVKLNRMVLNQFWQPAPQLYARASAGLYETMFAGAGGQLMYVPRGAGWTADLAVDYLAQRDFANAFKLRDYRVLTGLASAHVELPYDITGTVRIGRFLAKDAGARFEFKRELASGVQMGLWFSLTNGRDTTSPGSVAQPYRDKGIFLNIPFDVVSGTHTRRVINAAIAPWTRDVGQMVKSPGDLRTLLERGMLRTLQKPQALTGFGGVDGEEKP